MNRRGFLKACLASATAPYVVTTAGLLMPVRKVQTLADFTFFLDPAAAPFDYRGTRTGRWQGVQRARQNIPKWQEWHEEELPSGIHLITIRSKA